MKWMVAVWLEKLPDGQVNEEEGPVPANWVDEDKATVAWPKSNAKRLFDTRASPQRNWKLFDLVKVKCRSGNCCKHCFNLFCSRLFVLYLY